MFFKRKIKIMEFISRSYLKKKEENTPGSSQLPYCDYDKSRRG